MHPFFETIERLGVVQRRLAALMGVSDAHFSKVKGGMVPATPKFQRRAVDALGQLGFRNEDGNRYTVADLFLPAVVRHGTELVTHREAAHAVA